VHYPPVHSFSLYREDCKRVLPKTDDVAARLITLPLFPHMTEEQVDTVVDAVVGALGAAG
jgi:dTDP-4-amino-4,6-dideoxygalactose transaminase